MIGALLAVVLASTPVDAPLATLDESSLLDVREVQKGEPAPEHGVWTSEASARTLLSGLRGCEAERNSLRTSLQETPTGPSSGWVIGLVVGMVVGGAVVALAPRVLKL